MNNTTHRSVFLKKAGMWSAAFFGAFLASFFVTRLAFAVQTLDFPNGIINTSGNVGIGTTGPVAALQVYSGNEVIGSNQVAGPNYLQIVHAGSVSSTNYGYISFANNPTTPQAEFILGTLSGSSGGTLAVSYNNTTPALAILSGGNVGIGTASPAYKLDVAGTGNFTGAVNVGTPISGSNAATKSYVDSAVSGAVGNVSGSAGYVPVFTGTNTLGNSAVYQSGSNVGIGTASPSAKLDVSGNIQISNQGDNKLQVLQGGNTYQLIGTYAGWDANGVYIAGYNATNNASTASTTRVYIGGSGSSLPLTVTGSLTVSGGTVYNGATNAWQNSGAAWNVFTTQYGGIELGPANGSYAHIYSTNNLPFYFNTGVYTGAGNNLLNPSSGNSYLAGSGGNVGVGTTSPSYRLTVSGGSIGGNYGLTPNYASWSAYGTGDGGAAIYNDNGSYKELMIVGNTSGGGSRQVGLWDYLTVNGGETVTGNLTVNGTLSGTYSGTVGAGNVSAGTFGSNTGGGNYTFPSNIIPSTASNSGGGTWYLGVNAWGGNGPAVSSITSVTGLTYTGGSGSQLYTLSSGPGQASLQLDGSVFVGDNGSPYNPLGISGASDGYLLVDNGASFGGSVYTNGTFYGSGAGLTGSAGSLTAGALTNMNVSQFSNDSGYLTTSNFSHSLSTNGYEKLPDGLILQWGVVYPNGGCVAFNYPIAFPNAALNVEATTYLSTDRITYISTYNITGATICDNGSSADANWMAIGY